MTTKCPQCGRRCHPKSFRGSKPYLYDKVKPSEVEQRASDKIGVPIERYEIHKCNRKNSKAGSLTL